MMQGMFSSERCPIRNGSSDTAVSALPGTSRHHWGTDMDIWDAAAGGDGYRLSLTAAGMAQGVFEDVTHWLDARTAADDAEGFFNPTIRTEEASRPNPGISYRPVAPICDPRLSESLMPLVWVT